MLLDLVCQPGVRAVSFVGMAKNTGKTVAFNRLVAEASAAGLPLGLTSLGRDGERRDAVYFFPKPRIRAPVGTVIATARGSLARGTAEVETLRRTGFSTALGEVVIGRVRRAGELELAGPTLIGQHREVSEAMLALGAAVVLVDGALDRMGAAVPSLTDGVVLSTGAALGPGMRDVLDRTRDRIERFALAQVSEAGLLALCRELLGRAKAVLLDGDGEPRILRTAGSLTAGEAIAAAATGATRRVLLVGAAGDEVLRRLAELLVRTGRLELILRNGACLFCDRRLWRAFIAGGGSISVIEPIRLFAVTVNPAAVTGAGFEPHAFLALAREVLAPYPVVDVMQG